MNKLTFIVGNGNTRYPLELCIRSLMKYNSSYISEIIIVDNSSIDGSKEFFNNNPYKNITRIITYNMPSDLDPKIAGAVYRYIHIGLKNTKTKYALISHSDVEYKTAVVKLFFEKQKQIPNIFLCGIGGGNPNDPKAIHKNCTNVVRYHEWMLFIDVNQFKKSGYSFAATHKNNINYDIGSYLYKQAYNSGKKLISLGKEKDFIIHYCSGSWHNRENVKKQTIERLKLY